MHTASVAKQFMPGLATMVTLMLLGLASLVVVPGVSARTTAAACPSGVALGYYTPSLPNDLSAISAYERVSGEPAAIVHWYALWGGWKGQFSAADLALVAGHGSVPMITWEPWDGTPADPSWSLRAAILSGSHDAYIDSWARGMAAYGQPVLLRFAHEMHDQPSYPWAVGVNGNTPAEYVAAWRHVRSIFARYDTSNVRWIWNPNTLGDAPAAAYAATYQSVYPGEDAVDMVGLDILNTGPGVDWGAPYWRTFSQILAPPYAAMGALTGKPVILPEVGSTEVGGSKSNWITNALSTELANFPRVRALSWFDVSKEQPWQIQSSASALHAWLVALGSERFGAFPNARSYPAAACSS